MMCDEEPEIPPCCGGSEIIGGAELRNLIEGIIEHLQSGHVEFDSSQLLMQFM